MKLKSLLAGISVLAAVSQTVSCGDAQKEENKNKKEIEEQSQFQKKITLDSIKSVQLTEKAQKETDEWMMYIALNSEVKRFDNYTLLDVVNNSETIEKVVDSLSITVPKQFDTKAINARVVTLKTHANLLKENSDRVEPRASEIKDLSAKLKIDFNNLKIQLNEVFIIEENPDKSYKD